MANAAGGFDVQLSYTYAVAVQNQAFGVVITNTKNETLSDSTTRFSVTTAPVQVTAEIQTRRHGNFYRHDNCGRGVV